MATKRASPPDTPPGYIPRRPSYAPGYLPGMSDQQSNPGCLHHLVWFLGGFVIVGLFRARLIVGLILLGIWVALLSTKGPHASANAALGGVAFFVWLVLRVRRFIRVRREGRTDGGYHEG